MKVSLALARGQTPRAEGEWQESGHRAPQAKQNSFDHLCCAWILARRRLPGQVWKSKLCVVMKRGMSTGYSGVDNPLFYKKNARLFFGDAKKSVDLLVTETEKVPPPPQRFFL